jgi:hypothetical protein
MLLWFTTFLIGLTVVLMLFIAFTLLPRALRVGTMRRRFYCLWLGRNVGVRFLTCDGSRPISVMSCTAFPDPNVVTCDMRCVAEEGLRPMEERPTAEVASD